MRLTSFEEKGADAYLLEETHQCIKTRATCSYDSIFRTTSDHPHQPAISMKTSLPILCETFMASEWVKTEIAHARQKEVNQRRQVLFPISLVPFMSIRNWKCFDADTRKDSAREIREYYMPDLSDWKQHDQYQKIFERLLRDLRAEAPSQDREPAR
jgi:hypothetical protein